MDNNQKQLLGTVDLKMVGTIVKKDADVYEITYEASNKFWDESDVFSIQGESVYVYRNASDPEIKVGEKVLVHVSGTYWDQQFSRDLGNNGITMNVLQAKRIEPYTFDASVTAIQTVKSPSILLIFGFSIAAVIYLVKSKKSKKLPATKSR